MASHLSKHTAIDPLLHHDHAKLGTEEMKSEIMNLTWNQPGNTAPPPHVLVTAGLLVVSLFLEGRHYLRHFMLNHCWQLKKISCCRLAFPSRKYRDTCLSISNSVTVHYNPLRQGIIDAVVHFESIGHAQLQVVGQLLPSVLKLALSVVPVCVCVCVYTSLYCTYIPSHHLKPFLPLLLTQTLYYILYT